MSRRLVLLLVGLSCSALGCKERNPAWQGPAGDPTTSTTADSTGSGLGSSGSSEASPTVGSSSSATTSGATATSTTSGSGTSDTTADIPCNNDQQCPEELVCGPEFCQAGVEGDPCTARRHCAAEIPICASAGICQDGTAGDACADAGDCATPEFTCDGSVCG